MKKNLSLLLLSTTTVFAHDYDIKSRTFFSVITHFQTGSPEREAFFRDHFLVNETKRIGFEAVAFASFSGNADRLAQYFLPFGKCELLVAEEGASSFRSRDVDAIHLNINHVAPDNTFQSKVKFGFQQKVYGLGLAVRARIFPEKDSKWWVAASAPIESVRNEMKLREKIEHKGGELEATRVANVKQAFKQEEWCFGRIDCDHHTKVGVADIDLQAGYQWKTTGKSHGESYIGLVIPTGNKPNGKLVFEPIVGNNNHFGFIMGSMLSEQFFDDGRDSFYVVMSGNSRYLFANDQVRSFDLTDKQWGRYMEVYVDEEAAQAAEDAVSVADGDHGSPGINVFTKCLHVSPRFMHRFNAAFLYKHRHFNAEAGYNLTSRQSERVKLKKCSVGPALVAGEGSGTGNGDTTKSRSINHQAAGSDDLSLPSYATLMPADLDPTTAAHPALISHVLYLSIGYQQQVAHPEEEPSKSRWGKTTEQKSSSSQKNSSYYSWIPTCGLGASYEFSEDNTSLDRWTVWGKVELVY